MPPHPHILAVDIGNTSTTLGLYRAGKVSRVTTVPGGFPGREEIEAALRGMVKGRVIQQSMISSVVPRKNVRWRRAIKKVVGVDPAYLTYQTPLPIGIDFPKPETIGADRLANACGAAARYGRPIIVVDIGTAMTFDIVSKKRGYIGGIIAPGLPLMFDYMAEKTALLPHSQPAKLRRSIGRSTEEAMRIGAQLGYRGMVREMLVDVKKEMNERGVKVCATGGYAKWVMKEIDPGIPVERDLTLFGLGIICEYSAGTEVSPPRI